MKRRNFIRNSMAFGIGANCAFAGAASTTPDCKGDSKNKVVPRTKKNSQPHIIFIMSDQHRGDALHCMGNKAVVSPNIDSIAAEGTLFVNGYTSAPSSTPARAVLLTGLSPWHNGMLGYGRVAVKYKYEAPRMLRDLGYYTFGIGKMHWYPQKTLHGFHATLVDESGRVETPDFVSDYREWFQLHVPGKDPDVTGVGWNEHRGVTYKLDESLHPTTWTGQTACELIRNYDDDRPLFLKISFARPHSPYDPPQRLLDIYRDVDNIPAPYKGDWCAGFSEKKDPGKVAKNAAFANLGDDYAIDSRRHYYANVTFIDEQIGLIIKALKEKNMYDDALICYTADHGDMLGDHYHWRKTYAYEGSSHIPYIIKWPESMVKTFNIKKGGRVEQPVELRDFLPSFLDMAGGTIPDDMDGMSLVKLVSGKQNEWREYIDMEHSACYSPDNYWCALTDGRIKYIRFLHTDKEQLFDLTSDKSEEKDLSKDRRYQKLLSEMRERMVQHLSERGEDFVKDGRIVRRETSMLYSPNYPKDKKV